VTDSQPASQPSFDTKYRASKRRAGKNVEQQQISANAAKPALSKYS